ncbi:hypothetical protein QBC36DRAFT_388181 [Triangularia setosa]|uniref:Uncharacterized protein n=1 Tax=Triangularia setosa TaxID=2587417 RepID=A0AAN6W4X7_9PEZI|nr:hypothetical protein QBC36DRAFT_388181 [Podospora setosa]
MYLGKHTTENLSPSRPRRSATAPPDSQPINSAQTAALIVFGVLLGLIITGIIIWCSCCRGPGWRRRSSSRSKVKIIRMSRPRGEKGERGSPGPMGMQGVPGLPGPPTFLPLPAPAAPVPVRPLGPRGMLPGALFGVNAGAGEVTNESSRDCSPNRQNNSLFTHQHQHQHQSPRLNTQPNIPSARYALPPLLQSFAQPQTPVEPPVPVPSTANPAPQPLQPPQSQPLSHLQTQPPPQPLRIPPPLVYYARHHYPQDRVPIAKLISDHAAGVTRPLPLSLPIGRHGMVNLALKYQVHSEKGLSSRPGSRLESPRGTERGDNSCDNIQQGHDKYDAIEETGRLAEDSRQRTSKAAHFESRTGGTAR